MAKYVWVSDIHLDHIESNRDLIGFFESTIKNDPDGILISGDISNSKSLTYHLSAFEKVVQRQIMFVLGNHDYYGSDIESVRKEMKIVSNRSQYLKYLPLSQYSVLTPNTALVGHDGWYDGLYGSAADSNVMMNDWVMIADLVPPGAKTSIDVANMLQDRKPVLMQIIQRQAHKAMIHVQNGIKSATKYHKNIIVMTHIPPFPIERFRNSDDEDYYPWYASKLMGDMLLSAAKFYPNHHFTVLCGHCHTKSEIKLSNNLILKSASAQYGSPKICELINVD